jgi:hypothetical protein
MPGVWVLPGQDLRGWRGCFTAVRQYESSAIRQFGNRAIRQYGRRALSYYPSLVTRHSLLMLYESRFSEGLERGGVICYHKRLVFKR